MIDVLRIIFQSIIVLITMPSVNMLITTWCGILALIILWYAIVIARRHVCVCLDHLDLALIALGMLPTALFRLSLHFGLDYTLSVINSRVSLAWFLLLATVIVIRHVLILTSLYRHG